MALKNMIDKKPILKSVAAACICLSVLAGCVEERIINNGAIVTQDQLDLIPIGSSQDQVILALGSPSTTGQFGNEVFYYISQKRSKTYEFEKLKLIDQKVLSVYFDEEQTVSRVANYGVQDGRVFDFISRTTPTSGEEFTFLKQLLTGKASPASVLQPGQRDPTVLQGGGF